jgi:hypothetical protein
VVIDRAQRLKDLALSESGFLFDPYTGLTFSLNPTGRFMLERLREGLDVRDFMFLLRENGLLPAEERS